jgi:asparagine synthase (glutamine-hydrolysing)
MCGIYGANKTFSEEIICSKLSLMKSRGPDHSGFEIIADKKVTLGHNRLAIIDLDERSNQPMEVGGLWIVFNGEIYNFLELKSTLEKKGHTFHTNSDTEVILICYKEYGKECPKYLNGMFSFVIYDQRDDLFFGARDRLGKKPFYYRLEKGIFEFASTPAVIVKGDKEVTFDSDALGKYFLWGKVPEPLSIFSGVKKLPAGCYFQFELESRKLTVDHYWQLDLDPKVFDGSYAEARRHLDFLLTDSVKKRMVADVPVGVFLSGGIDSSVVAALAQKVSQTRVHTFSVRFNESAFDESMFAKRVSDRLGTVHTEIECSYKEAIDLIINMSEYYDEPFDDSSAIPSLLLAKHTRKQVVVALSGDGGDESFLGYSRYLQMLKKQHLFELVPLPVRQIISCFVKLLPGYKPKYISEGLKAKNINEVYLKSFTGQLIEWHTYKEQNVEYFEYLWNKNKPLLERISDFDLKNYLNNDINTKVDRATMAFSLEARAPLMDYRVVEFARTLPTSFKWKNGVQKRILKDVLYDYLPAEIFNRPKSGFSMPIGLWFRGVLKEYVYDTLSKKNLDNIPFLNIGIVNKYLDDHMKGKNDFHVILWRLIQLVDWKRKYVFTGRADKGLKDHNFRQI